jgi:hypothetical protein
MKKYISFITVIALLLLTVNCKKDDRIMTIKFDSSREVSGRKFAIRDISPGLPENWDDFNFVVLEFRSTTSQRFHVGFTTDSGYNELRVMSYVPYGWNKLAIPLKFYRQLPGANIDLAATYNQPRYTGWINLGGKRGPLHGVDSIGIRMRAPIGNPEISIRSISLSVEDPGDQYLEQTPAVDEFGQWNLGDYEGKVHSIDQLKAEWTSEDNEATTANRYNYSQYGGYLNKRVVATGFFRTESINGKWWFVDPEGYLFLSVGVDCISPGRGGNVKDADKRKNMFSVLPPVQPDQRNPGQTSYIGFGQWNLQRRYGDNYLSKANEMIINRMEKWGINTIGNWSDPGIIGMNRMNFMVSMRPAGVERSLMGLADVYGPDYQKRMDESIKASVEPYRNNPRLIGYFVGNEPAWLGEEVRLCSLILDGDDKPIKTALVSFLKGGDTPERRKEFIFNTFRTYLASVRIAQKKFDPNHLNLGIRFGNVSGIDEEILKICREYFDVLSFNCYDLCPKPEMLDRALKITGLPMIIGEFHFGTVDRGMAQSLWQVDSQKERGVAYRYYTEQGYSHPGLIGTAYFQWCDQDLTGRNDGENYNCGLIDVTDRPYKYQVEAMSETALKLFDVHSGITEGFSQKPLRARGHGQIPDLWD